MKFLLSFALLSLGARFCKADGFNWTIVLEDVDVDLSEDVDKSEAVKFHYDYFGVMPIEDGNATLEFHIYKSGCDDVYATHDDTSVNGVYVYQTAILENDPAPNDLTVEVMLDVEHIATDLSGVWQQDADATEATLSFCGRLEVYYGDGQDGRNKTFVNFHETDMNATIDLLEDGGFDVTDVHFNLVQDDESESFDHLVEVDYDLDVYLCDEDDHTLLTGTGNTTVTQGDPVVFCVKVHNDVNEDHVYVEDIHEFRYWSTNQNDGNPQDTVIAVSNGEINNLLTDIDCGVLKGVCRIKFIVDALLFADASEEQKDLQVGGNALVHFGTDATGADPVRRLGVANLRNLLTEGGQGLSDYHYNVGPFEDYKNAVADENLAADDEKSRGGLYFGIIAILLALGGCAAFQYFFCFARRREQRGNAKTLEESTVDSPATTPATPRRTGSDLMVDVNMA